MKTIITYLFLSLFIQVTVFSQEATVYFNTGSAVPESEEMGKIKTLVKKYTETGASSIKVIGYADTTSNWAFNLALSQKRSKSIKALLIENGIPTEEIITQHKGEGSGSGNLKFDRKAEIFLQKDGLTLAQIFREYDVEKQYFNIDPLKESELKCARGTVLQIPKNCFVDDKGNVITSKINLVVQEYYNLGDYAKMGLFTTAKNGLLESGGVINVNASFKGKPVSFNNGMKMGIGFNAPPDAEMKAFYISGGGIDSPTSWFEDLVSKNPGKGLKGSEIWVKDSVLLYETDEKGKRISADSSVENSKNIRTYRFVERRVPTVYVNNLGFINCDKFWNDPSAREMEITVSLSHLSKDPETKVYMIFQKTMSVLPLTGSSDDMGIFSFKSPKMKMPYGSKAHIIAVNKTGKKFYLGTEVINLDGKSGANVKIFLADLKDITAVLARYSMN